ncbi:type II toxin-antitoxin system VapC family toxin [Phragmitibacter flavus]|nr:type II toxin-antitoxin system VapC family toxin [Phragmitibacter flavus]
MIAAQSISEELTLVTIDPAFQTIPNLRLLW